MPTDHAALRVGHARVQVRPVGRERAGEREDLAVAGDLGGVVRAGQAQASGAADAGHHPRRLRGTLGQRGLQCSAQVGARGQAQRFEQRRDRRSVAESNSDLLVCGEEAVNANRAMRARCRTTPLPGRARSRVWSHDPRTRKHQNLEDAKPWSNGRLPLAEDRVRNRLR
jgi:hypothetical protein